MKTTLISCLTLVLLASASLALGDLLIDDFENGIDSGWAIKEFAGHSEYRPVRDGAEQVLSCRSDGTASSLYFRKKIDLGKTPVLTWRWKIESTVEKGDASRREGNDYAARVYVVFPHWLFFKTRAINYIWANRLAQGAVVPNPFTANAMMLAVQSGNSKAGQWVEERRNVFEDFKQIFGEEPPLVGGVAIMCDSDNTGSSAQSWYDDIRFLQGD